MTQSSRRRLLQGMIAGTVAGSAGPGLVRAATETKVLTVRAEQDIITLDPAFTVHETDRDIMDVLFPKLISYKPGTDYAWELDAAEAIEQVDETHIRFKLRSGIMFNGGFGEMTAEDVKYSFERIAAPQTGSPYASDWEALDHVQVDDTYTGVIVLKTPFAPLWWSTLPWGSGSIVSKSAVESVGGRFGAEPPASSGPYYLREWIPQQRIVLARHDGWPGPAPYYDEIVALPIGDDNAAELAFAAGEVDYAGIGAGALPRYKDTPEPDTVVREFVPLNYQWLGMNVERAPYDDVRVRRAVQMAVNVQEIIDAAYFGEATRATGIVAPGLLGHRDIEMPPPDLEGARRLLAEAGHAEGFSTQLAVINQSDYLAIAQVIQANLAQIGVDVVINSYEEANFQSLGLESEGDAWRELELVYQEFFTAPDPFWTTVWFVCEQVGVWNWQRWCDKDFDRLHDAAIVELDFEARDRLYQRMQDLMWDSGAFVFTTHGVKAAVHHADVVPGVLPDGRLRLAAFRQA